MEIYKIHVWTLLGFLLYQQYHISQLVDNQGGTMEQ